MSGAIDYEFKFPLVLFTDLNLAGRWGLNIGRHDTAAGNVVSLIHTKEINFHLPALFPALVFPDGILDAYRVGFRSLTRIDTGNGKPGVSGMVGNLTGRPLDAEIRIREEGTGEVLGSLALTLENGDNPFMVPVKLSGAASVLDGLAEIEAGGKTLLSRRQRLPRERRLELFTRYNYYMNEENAVLTGTLRLPDADRLIGRVTVAGHSFETKMEDNFAIDVPLANIPDGTHELVLTVLDGEDAVVRGTTVLIKRPYRKDATQIDRQRRCLVVDGKPRLVIAPFFGVPRGVKAEDREQVLENMVRHHTDMGYRDLLIGAVDDPPVAEMNRMLFDRCARENIKILFWPFQSWRRREEVGVQERLQSVSRDGIIGWLVVDEPELYAESAEVETFLKAYRAASPYVPIFMNNTLIGIPSRSVTSPAAMKAEYMSSR